MDNRANEAYLIAIINGYERKINSNKGLTQTTTTSVLKEVVATLSDLYDFMSDKKATDSKSTLELNADHTESVRAYKETITEQECTITTLSMDVYNFGYIEKENKILESENLELKSRLAMASVSGREIRELKSDIQLWQTLCTEQRQKIEKLTGPHWVD